MNRIKTIMFWMCIGLMVGSISFMTAGCDEEQLARVDYIADATQKATDTAQDVLKTPAGALIPPLYKTIAQGTLAGLASLAGVWLTYRKKEQYKTAASELAYAIDIFEKDSETGNEEIKSAKAAALNPPTVKLLRKMNSVAA